MRLQKIIWAVSMANKEIWVWALELSFIKIKLEKNQKEIFAESHVVSIQ